ncbi:MAG: AMP-binding protein [Gemmatimonadota bacterium]
MMAAIVLDPEIRAEPAVPTRVPDEVLARTLPGRVALWARRQPDAVALRRKRFGIWKETTWSEYCGAIETVAHALRRLGVEPGNAVGILSDNRPEWLYVDLAAQAIGACSAGIYQTNPAEDVAYILNHAQAVVAVCEDQEQVDKALEVRDETPTVRHVIVLDARGTRDYDDPRLMTWSDFMEAGAAARAEDPDWFEGELAARDPTEPGMLVYTSGTTGRPKGAELSSASVIGLWEHPDVLEASPDDTLLSYLPLCHIAEKLFSLFIPLRSGCVVHFGESLDTVQEDLREVSPTIFLGVPRIWEKMHAGVTIRMRDSSWLKRRLFERGLRVGREIAGRRLEGRETRLDRLRWFINDLLVYRPLQERLGLRRCRFGISGAAPVASELLLWFWSAGVPIYEGYGLTETGAMSHLNRPGAVRLGTVGLPLPGIECRTAEDGEVLIRGPNIFLGYRDNPEATRAAIDDEGWLHTGDTGVIDDDGFLSIVGRKKEIIITSGGKNLSPEKIENALKLSPFVKEAVAVGDGRKFISALVQIDYDIVSDWATRRRLSHSDYTDLARRPEVKELVSRAVDEANEHLARVEQVRALRIIPKELHQDDGELTATRKVRRKVVHERFDDLVRDIYGEE